jgi:predicted GH43/DUF377 family glycosyl hydrolase
MPAILRFPATWKRVADPIEANNGSHLSRYRMAADTSVVQEGSSYRLYFTGNDSRERVGIAQAHSRDGLNWTTHKKAVHPDPIVDLVVAPGSTWGVTGLETAHAMTTPQGQHRLYYTEDLQPNGTTYAIGLATSSEGMPWKRSGTTPIFKALRYWEQPVNGVGGVLEPCVLYDAAARLYKMWYVGCGMRKGVHSYRVGYATSPNGINSWTRRDNPVLERGPAGAWDELWVSHVNVVADPAGGYHMFYHGTAASEYVEGAVMQRGCVGHAYSLDGIRWLRNPDNPIIRPRVGKFDAWAITSPTAIFVKGKLRVYYSGFATSDLTSNVGVLEAATMYPAYPASSALADPGLWQAT